MVGAGVLTLLAAIIFLCYKKKSTKKDGKNDYTNADDEGKMGSQIYKDLTQGRRTHNMTNLGFNTSSDFSQNKSRNFTDYKTHGGQDNTIFSDTNTNTNT